jgi:transposase
MATGTSIEQFSNGTHTLEEREREKRQREKERKREREKERKEREREREREIKIRKIKGGYCVVSVELLGFLVH